MQKFTTCLWFDGQAEEAAKFYTSVFKNSKIKQTTRYGESSAQASGQPKGSVLTITFDLDGHEFMALNGGPPFKFTEAISIMVNCKTQEEIDELWGKLSANKDAEQCGWLKDKFGVSWQIVPTIIGELIQDKNPQKSDAVMKALVQMKKLDIKKLQEAYQNT